jgi:hypothetical protein
MLNQDDDFVSVCDFARHYYSEYHWQIMPLSPRSKIPPKDFPAIDMQKGLLDQESFDRMWGKNGAFISNYNCGVLCGAPSGGLFVVDLDTQKPGSPAQGWWDDLHSMRPHPETPTQVTGSGGTQIFFKMPEGMKAFNHKSASLNVDFQGEGAYVVLPPSTHPNGNSYRWVDGMSPDDCEIMVLPDYLIEEIQQIIGYHGDYSSSSHRVKTSTPDHQIDSWGKVVDGREDLMTRMVFKAVLELYRDCPIIPSEKEQFAAMAAGFEVYLGAVDPRLNEIGVSKEDLLEKEGRGRSLYEKKWRSAIRQWDEKISVEAARPFVKEEPKKADPFDDPIPKREIKLEGPSEESSKAKDETEEPSEEDFGFETKKKTSLKLYTLDEIDSFVPPKAIIQDVIAENTLGFIYGPPGCGKTFVALSLGLSVAYGFEHWLWKKKIERTGPVVYISLEGRGDIKYRTQAWRKHHGVQKNNFFRIILDPVNFMNDDRVREFVSAIDEFVAENPNPVLIVIDTVSRAIAGGDENDQKDMSKFIEICDKIKNRYLTSVIGVHHSGRSGTNMRGSTVLDGGADFMLRIERDKENENMEGKIHAEKIKAYPDGWTKNFTLTKIDLDAFGAVTSLVATSAEEMATSEPRKPVDEDFGKPQETGSEPDMDTCRKMVLAIEDAWRGGYPWSRDKKSRDTGRYAPEKLSDSFGYSIEICEKYVNLWHRQDVIVTDFWGDKSSKKGLRIGKGL